MKEKLQIKNTLFQLTIGLVAYFLFIRKTIVAKTPTLTVGEIIGVGSPYSATYFKDSEYFGKYEVPQNYIGNWWSVARMLDKIRLAFGSPIIISKGYSPSLSGIITDTFQTCLSVQIKPQNGNLNALYQVVKVLQDSGQIKPVEFLRVDAAQFKITVYGQ